jgi:co-chaperonin GroES (HSP10)
MSDKKQYSAKVIGHLILIRPDPVVEKTKSGLVLAVDKKLERNAGTSGTVLEVGPEAFLAFQEASGIPMAARKPWVKSGDHIYHAKYAGKWIDDAATGEELLFIRDEDVLGLV